MSVVAGELNMLSLDFRPDSARLQLLVFSISHKFFSGVSDVLGARRPTQQDPAQTEARFIVEGISSSGKEQETGLSGKQVCSPIEKQESELCELDLGEFPHERD